MDIVIKFLDAFGVYRMLLAEPITHSSIRNAIYLKIKDIRNIDLPTLTGKLSSEISEYRKLFLNEDYCRFDSNSKYILSRLYKNKNTNIGFENIYFQRRKDSYVLYQFLKIEDFDSENLSLPKGLKDMLVQRLCSFIMVPKQLTTELDNLSLVKRIQKLINGGYILEFSDISEIDLNNLKDFFIKKEKKMKELILNLWKLPNPS